MTRSILVIDDEEPIRKSLELLLRIKGYEVVSASDGHRGLELLASAKPSVVITDIIMPGAEGIETIIRIKATNPDVRVIAMSGGGRVNGRDFLALAREMGADACIDKPFQADELLATVGRCLGKGEAAV